MMETPPQGGASVDASPGASGARKLTILHFNDIYNIEPGSSDPAGGAARFAYKVKEFRDAGANPLVLFSGDAFNPSMMSTLTLGRQMVPVLNALGVACACVGNHDFDYGADNLVALMGQCSFPWLMANVLDKNTGVPFATAGSTWVKEWNGIKVGIAGLVEQEWLDTLRTISEDDLQYQDFVEVGRRLAKELKEAGAEVLIALTHMREPNDRRLASEVPDFHLVLGGHDHHYVEDRVAPHGSLLVKSGTDFRDLSCITVELPAGGCGAEPSLMRSERIAIVKALPEDPDVAAVVSEYLKLMGDKMDELVGSTLTDLDGRFTTVRTRESNLGNFVCDVWRKAVGADVALLNSGSLRSDAVLEAGPLRAKDFVAVLPMVDETVLLECTGEQIVQALENGVSAYPKLEGRFPQVSGIRFAFNPALPPMQRIIPGSVVIAPGEDQPQVPLEYSKLYKVATKSYMWQGKDGYDVLSEAKVLVDSEDSVVLPTVIRNHFTVLSVMGRWDKTTMLKAAVDRWKATSRKAEDAGENGQPAGRSSGEYGLAVYQPATSEYAIAPVVDGRITNLAEAEAAAP